jgi:Zn-dependent metalloprotease
LAQLLIHIVKWVSLAAFLGGTACQSESTIGPRSRTADASTSIPSTTEIRRDSGNHTILSLKDANLSLPLEQESEYRNLLARAAYAEMAKEFIDRHRDEFLLESPSEELRLTRLQADALGFHQVRLQQYYRELPVLETEIIVHFNEGDHIYLVQGHYAPTPSNLSVRPALSDEEIEHRTVGQLGGILSVRQSHLTIFLHESRPYLAYRLILSRTLTESWEVIADANSGAILRQLPVTYHIE